MGDIIRPSAFGRLPERNQSPQLNGDVFRPKVR